MGGADVVELVDEARFLEYLQRGGVIVIHDDANRAAVKRVAHLHTERNACSHVDVENFREKVLTNSQGNGRYWWARNSRIAADELQATLCTDSKRLLGRT